MSSDYNRLTERQHWGMLFVLFGIILAVGVTIGAIISDLNAKTVILGIILYFIAFCCVMGGTDLTKGSK